MKLKCWLEVGFQKPIKMREFGNVKSPIIHKYGRPFLMELVGGDWIYSAAASLWRRSLPTYQSAWVRVCETDCLQSAGSRQTVARFAQLRRQKDDLRKNLKKCGVPLKEHVATPEFMAFLVTRSHCKFEATCLAASENKRTVHIKASRAS